jgi:hypothetical protein
MFASSYHAIRQTIRSNRHHAYRPSHISTVTVARRCSKQSASVCNERVKQVVDQLHTPERFGLGAETSKSSSHPIPDIQPTRTEQLVWLAQHSLAGSTLRKRGFMDANGHKGIAMTNIKQGAADQFSPSSAQSWDGPTVWAYLW